MSQGLEPAYGCGIQPNIVNPESTGMGKKRLGILKDTGDSEGWIGSRTIQKQFEEFWINEVKKAAKQL